MAPNNGILVKVLFKIANLKCVTYRIFAGNFFSTPKFQFTILDDGTTLIIVTVLRGLDGIRGKQ